MLAKNVSLIFLIIIMIVYVNHLSAQQVTDMQVHQEQDKKIIERTEAQRFYDLGISYFMSHMYREGMDTINKVAFLYPDSDVADDALYQLALLREQSGNGEIDIGVAIANELSISTAEKIRANNLFAGSAMDAMVRNINELIVLSSQKKRAIETAKISAINEYLLALDYLGTLFQRYPESDKKQEAENTQKGILDKIDKLTKKEVNDYKKEVKDAKINRTFRLAVLGSVISLTLLAVIITSFGD